MGTTQITAAVLIVVIVAAGVFLFWRYVWFFRNPDRIVPAGQGLVSAADGTVVYVKTVPPDEEVLSVKQGVSLRIRDIVREDVAGPKLVIGVFMSPFNVHYNRVPLSGTVELVRHHPAVTENHHMGVMHLRTLFKLPPYYSGSVHVLENERTVTRISGTAKGGEITCYVVQIAGWSVHGIDSYVAAGDTVSKGQVLGMIRIGSQVDLVIPYQNGMNVKVRPGDRVYAGETVVVE